MGVTAYDAERAVADEFMARLEARSDDGELMRLARDALAEACPINN